MYIPYIYLLHNIKINYHVNFYGIFEKMHLLSLKCEFSSNKPNMCNFVQNKTLFVCNMVSMYYIRFIFWREVRLFIRGDTPRRVARVCWLYSIARMTETASRRKFIQNKYTYIYIKIIYFHIQSKVKINSWHNNTFKVNWNILQGG